MTRTGWNATHLSRPARRFVFGAWVLLTLGVLGLALSSSGGLSAGPTILFVTAGLVAALAALCAGRAIEAHGVRARLLWVGRALGLIGAALAVVFPAVLYQEIVALVDAGRPLGYDIEAAMWHEFQLMPLVVVPALVALRWARLGGVLFVLGGVFQAIEMLYHPFGNFYPEAATGGPFGILILDLIIQPAFISSALLLFGGSGAALHRRAEANHEAMRMPS